MGRRARTSRLQRAVVTVVLGLCLALCVAGTALAADSLPSPDAPAKKAQTSSDLPMTGIDGSLLVLAGVAFVAMGIALRPAARRRRRFRTETWEQVVRSTAR